jgi:hypothetical protein
MDVDTGRAIPPNNNSGAGIGAEISVMYLIVRIDSHTGTNTVSSGEDVEPAPTLYGTNRYLPSLPQNQIRRRDPSNWAGAEYGQPVGCNVIPNLIGVRTIPKPEAPHKVVGRLDKRERDLVHRHGASRKLGVRDRQGG